MDEFTKNDIGKKVYVVSSGHVSTTGQVLVNIGTVENVSIDGKCVKVLFRSDEKPEEHSSSELAKSYDGLKSLFEGLANSETEPYKLMAYRRKLDNACVCIVDTQITDKYGDTTFYHAHNVNGNTPTWKYGTNKDKGLMTVDAVCAFINEHFKYPFGSVYTMNKATNNWWMCPHCGSSDTGVDEEHGGGDEKFTEYYSCRECGCQWENIYDRAPRIERKLIK